MDYGVMIKQATANPGRRSAHHTRQSPFKGSNREVRSRILSAILAKGATTEQTLVVALDGDEERVKKNLADLEQEGFLVRKGRQYVIREG
jgi:A/G-specific adenine glycosylase